MIAYKSHSGSAIHMNMAIELDLFSSPNSNLGAAPQRFIYNAQLDSLIFLDDTSTVMVTSNRCYNLDSNNSWGRKIKEVWSAGRDTVINHNTFNRNLTEKKIRNEIKTKYNFANDAQKIVFVNHVPESAFDSAVADETKIAPTKKKKNKARKSKSTKTKKGKRISIFKKPGCATFITLLYFVSFGFSIRKYRQFNR